MSKQQSLVEKKLKALFPDLKSEVVLNKITGNIFHKSIRVDIWIPEINCIVEIHGIQHFKESGFGKDNISTKNSLLRQIERDDRLINICKQFNINYEQIDYNETISYVDLFRKFEKYI